MANLTFNIALGKVKYYAELGAANDALIAVPIETSGIVSDATMRDYDDLAALLAGASNEQTTMGRKTLTGVTVTVNDTLDRVELDSADITWTSATGNPVSAIVICYDADTTSGSDSDIVPIIKADFTVTPDGTNVTANVADFFRATSNG